MLLRIIYSLYFYLLAAIYFILGISIILFSLPFSKSKTKLFQTAAHLWARALTFSSGVRIKVSGIENIPKAKPLMLVSNHQGVPDILLLLAYLPIPFRFIIKMELFKIPLFGWYLKRAGYLSVDRKSLINAHRMVEKMVEISKTGESILIFPEGTRTKSGEIAKFKRGSLVAALKSGAPVIPIAISGSFDILPRGTWIINPQPVRLSVGKPIYIKSEAEYSNKLEEVRKAIAKML